MSDRKTDITLCPLKPKEALKALLETKPPPKAVKEGKK